MDNVGVETNDVTYTSENGYSYTILYSEIPTDVFDIDYQRYFALKNLRVKVSFPIELNNSDFVKSYTFELPYFL